MTETCKCGKGKVSKHDGKCGHCRTKKEKDELNKRLGNMFNPADHLVVNKLTSGSGG